METVLKLDRITKSYPLQNRELKILRGISLNIKPGEFLAIMGPSGSGKSTLLHVMGGLDHPTSGKLFISGMDVTHYNDEEMARLRNSEIGFVFQNFFLLNYYTAIENVCLPLVYAGKKSTHTYYGVHLMERLGLGARLHHKPNELSGGEKQRVAIARALINSPKILFADEPTGALDSKTGESILQLLREINRTGTTIVLITHDPNIGRQAHRMIRIEDGQLI